MARGASGTRRSTTSIDTSTDGLTGIQRRWTFNSDTIAGVGRYMINVNTGNLVVQSTDMALPNKGADLVFTRTYNTFSQHDYTGTDGSTPSSYGDGWTNTFDAHLAADNDGGISVFDAAGTRFDYHPDGYGGLGNWDGIAATLTSDGANVDYWTQKDGTTLYFYGPNQSASNAGLNGRLKQILGAQSQ